MFRLRDIAMVAAMLGTVGVTYTVKERSEATSEAIEEVKAQIRLEQNAIDLLEADLGLMTQPNRIQVLVERFSEELKLQPLDAGQYATLSQIPPRPISQEQSQDGLEEAMAILGQDDIHTGSIRR